MRLPPTLRLICSYERRVIQRASGDWLHFFGLKGLGLYIFSVIVGFAAVGFVRGIESMLDELSIWSLTFLCPAAFVFLWYLFRSSAIIDHEQRYEMAHLQSGIATHNELITTRAALIRSWRELVDEIERQSQEQRFLSLEPVLRRHPDYYRLEQYLPVKVRKAISETSAGIRITPTVAFGHHETIEARAIRMLRQEIARIEREWGLI